MGGSLLFSHSEKVYSEGQFAMHKDELQIKVPLWFNLKVELVMSYTTLFEWVETFFFLRDTTTTMNWTILGLKLSFGYNIRGWTVLKNLI